MKDALDFAAINQAALAAFPAVLNAALAGRQDASAREIVALNPRRADRNLGSFKVNRYNGRWCDFATGDKGGDPISLGRLSRGRFAGRGGAVARANARAWKPEGAVMDDASDPFAPLRRRTCGSGAARAARPKPSADAPPICPPADAEPGALAAARLYRAQARWALALCDGGRRNRLLCRALE